ncbi:zinc finger X-linked protein ZXDA-like [Onthophagus taurus]|uniref:zinc finger X-linked protein ZXDA-like n=1 Tax=Onthophagus taurus TaxID=166361 RepID=UPI0039BDE9D4
MAEDLSIQTLSDDCIFIGSPILEQTENLEDWLNKNGHYLIANDLETLLTEDNENITSDEKDIQLKVSKKGIKNIKNQKQDKIINVESCVKKGLEVYFSFNGTKVSVKFFDKNNKEVMHEYLASLSEMSGPILKEKERQSVIEVTKISINEIPNLFIPCLLTEMGIRIFLCPQNICNQAFSRIGTAKLHALVHIGYKPYQCDYPDCTWAFYTHCKLKRHQTTHEKRKDFVCPIDGCLRRFTTIYNLNNHKRLHERPAELPCPVESCTEKFQSVRDREKHLKTHDRSEAPFRCSFQNCNRSFFLTNALTAHTRTHDHKESELKCKWPNCGKIFEHPCRLKEHSRKHTGQRPYLCTFEDCKWTFSTASKLKRHQSIHTNERKFHCTIGTCNKSFLRSEHLKEHTLTHIGQRSYQCEVCAATFLGKSALFLHLNKSHPDQEACARALPFQNNEKINQDVLLEQAIQSLGVPSDMILGPGLLPEEPMELLETENFSTVNLRDLD